MTLTPPMPPRVVRTPKRSLRWAVELLWILSVHRVSIRYKGTLFGFGWIFLQPVALTIILTYIFHRFAGVTSGTVPYPLFVATGLVAWSMTALVVSQSAISLTTHHDLLKRVALPRLVIPLSIVMATLADLCVMSLLLVGLFIRYHATWPATALWVPGLLLMHAGFLVGLSCLTALANVFLRDVTHALPSLLQLWFFTSPIFYPSSMVPQSFKALARWNPLAGFIEGYRATLLLGQAPPWDLVGPALLVSVVVLVAGVVCFVRLEGVVSDAI